MKEFEDDDEHRITLCVVSSGVWVLKLIMHGENKQESSSRIMKDEGIIKCTTIHLLYLMKIIEKYWVQV